MDDEHIEQALRSGPPDEPAYLAMGAVIVRTPRKRAPNRGGLGSLLATTGVAAAVLVGLLSLRLAQPTEPGPGTHDLLAEVQSAGRLRIGVTSGSPQVQVNGAGYAGFDVDVALAIADRLGVPAQVDVVDPKEIEQGGWEDRWDLAIDSASSTGRRAAVLTVGPGYYTRQAAVIVRSGSGIERAADLNDQRLCVVQDGLAGRWLDGTLDIIGGRADPPPPGIQVVTEPSVETCVASVTDGEVAAYVADWAFDPSAISSGLTQLPQAPFVAVAGPAVDPSRPGSERLMEAVDRIVADLREDGTLRELSERRFGGSDLSALP